MSCSSGPLVHPALRLGSVATCPPRPQSPGVTGPGLVREFCWGRKHDGCRWTGRDRKCQSWRAGEALSPHLELVEGKIVCDDAASEPSAHQ